MGKKSKKTTYYEYYISMDFGLCWGPVDQLVQIYFKEKAGFDGEDGITGVGLIHVNKPELFGGFEREGGIVGAVSFRPGNSTQVLPVDLASRMNVAVNNAPGYRHIACVALHGDDNSGRRGASVACNSPNVPSVWTRLRRSSKTLGVNSAVIPYNDTAHGTVRTNANPASVLHEIIANDEWGMGGEVEDLDLPSFFAAAEIFREENFGISFTWAKQSNIEDMAQEILDHVNAMMYFNPYTAKVVLKAIRDDYDRDSLRQYGPDTCQLTSFKRKLWGETVNDVTVTWTDPASEENSTVTYQDPGNIAMQGTTVSVNRNYYMARDVVLATNLCKRDLQLESAPLASVSIKVDRTQWQEMPGDCIKFQWPDYDIENMILRVMDIDWGTVDNSLITVNLVEDIFSFQLAEFSVPGGSEWEDPGQDPDSPDYFVMNAKFFAAPLSLLQQDFGEAAAPYLVDANYPKIVIAAAVTPIPGEYDENGHLVSGQPDLQSYFMWVPGVATTGEPEWQSLGEKQITGAGKTRTPMVQEVRTTVTIGSRIGGEGPEVGRYAIIGDGDEYTDEWVLFEQNLGGGTWVIRRGVLDTTPKDWPVDTSMYFISLNFDSYDTDESLAFEVERYKLQPRTSLGIRDLEGTQVVTTTRPDRPYLPYRPANVKIDSVMFYTIDDSQEFDKGDPDDDTHEPRERWVYNVSWSRRNRFLEENVVQPWDGADIVPEDGQTTEIIIYAGKDATGEELKRITGLTGTSYEFDIIAHTGRIRKLSLKFISRRGELESLQGHVINMELYLKGYGSDWGYLWGGWPVLGNVGTQIEGDMVLPGVTIDGQVETE